MVGKPISYKMKQAEYDAQFPEMAGAVSQEVPRFDYPELVCGPCAPVQEEDEVVFSDDEEGADDEVSLEDLEFSDDEDEEEKCEDCGKALEGDDKCGEGCPAYDQGLESEGADDEPVSPKEAELEEALEEHTWAPAGERHTLPDGTILEADGTGGVKVIDAPEEEMTDEEINALVGPMGCDVEEGDESVEEHAARMWAGAEEEVETEVIDAPEESQSDDDDRQYEGAGALLEASSDSDDQ